MLHPLGREGERVRDTVARYALFFVLVTLLVIAVGSWLLEREVVS